MWTCPNCGEHNEDQFQECWNCVSEAIRNGTAPKLDEAPPRQLRSLGWVLARALVAFLIAMFLALAVDHRNGVPLAEAALSGAIFGLVAGAVVGIFVWVVFPYKPARPSGPRDHERDS